MTAPAASSANDRGARIDRAFAIANSLQQAGQWRVAEPLYRRILAIEPKHFAALFRLGALRAQRGDSDAAAWVFAAAARAAPQSAAVQARVGVALAGDGPACKSTLSSGALQAVSGATRP
jgi:thioredoxin-like negative regulator of GroEL